MVVMAVGRIVHNYTNTVHAYYLILDMLHLSCTGKNENSQHCCRGLYYQIIIMLQGLF